MIKQQLSARSEKLSSIISEVYVRKTAYLFAMVEKDLKGNTRTLY